MLTYVDNSSRAVRALLFGRAQRLGHESLVHFQRRLGSGCDAPSSTAAAPPRTRRLAAARKLKRGAKLAVAKAFGESQC